MTGGQRTYPISHLAALFLGLFFYTSIGSLFVISSVPLRVMVFLLMLLFAHFKRSHYIIVLVACTIGFIISPIQDWATTLSNVLSWGGLTGSVIGSLLVYNDIFTGGDFASVSRFFKNKNAVAIHAYYVFKVIPMITDLLKHIQDAFQVYGKRKYMVENNASRRMIALDVIESLFSELLHIMFSQVRVMDRRERVAYSVSRQKREIGRKALIIQVLVITLVIACLIVRLTLTRQ